MAIRADTALNKFTDNQHCKRLKLPFMTTMQSKASFGRALSCSKMILNLAQSFLQPPLISFKRDKNIGNFLVRSVLKSDNQPGCFKYAHVRCKTCPYFHNVDKISGPKQSIKITDRFTCTCANVVYCIKCTLFKHLYIGETGRRLGDRFREHLRDIERNNKDASKPVVRHNLSNHC